MSATTMSPALENAYIRSLESQLGNHASMSKSDSLAIVSANPNLDLTAVPRLREAGALVLRSDSESLSKTLEAGLLADAIVWATTEAGISSLTLIGHSMAATMPFNHLTSAPGMLERMQLHNERVGASRLKLKDDLARFVGHPLVTPLLSDGKLSIHALFYLQESGVWLRYDLENDDFVYVG